MLALTRRVGEEVVVGDDCFIHILALGQGKVRLGITAPRELSVHRREVWESLQANGKTLPKPEDDVVNLERVNRVLVRQKLPPGTDKNGLLGQHCKCGSTHLTNLKVVKIHSLCVDPDGSEWVDLQYELKQ